MSLWVNSVVSPLSVTSPLYLQLQTFRCVALTDAVGQKATSTLHLARRRVAKLATIHTLEWIALHMRREAGGGWVRHVRNRSCGLWVRFGMVLLRYAQEVFSNAAP